MGKRGAGIETIEKVGACLTCALVAALLLVPALAAYFGPAELEGAGQRLMQVLSVAGPMMFGIGRYLTLTSENAEHDQPNRPAEENPDQANKHRMAA